MSNRFLRPNLHIKLMAALGLVFLPILIFTGYLPLQRERSFLLDQARLRAANLLRALELVAGASIAQPQHEPFRTLMQRTFGEDSDVVAIRLLDRDGRVLCEQGPRAGVPLADRFVSSATVFRDKDRVGLIELSYGLSSAQAGLQSMRTFVLLTVTDCLLVLGFVLHLALRRMVTAPLSELTRLSGLIADGDLSQRMKELSADELGTLARSFNHMTSALQKSREELSQVNRELEDRVRDRTAQLAREKARTEAIIASMADGLITFDAQRIVTGMNAAAEQLTGLAARDAIGRPCHEVVRCEVCATRCLHLRALEEKRSVAEEDVLLQNGTPIAFASALLHGPDGEVMGGVETFRDIGPFKRLVQKVQRADRLSTVGTLAAGIAHELNNPIGNISTFSQLLMERDNPDREFLKKGLATIAGETERAGKIIRGLLDFSRQTPAQRIDVDLVQVIESALKVATPGYSSRASYQVDTSLPKTLPPLIGDPMQLQQVFLNILNNAFQAMPGGGRIEVRILPEPVERQGVSYIAAEIQDSGPGIAEEDMPRLFDPFFTTKQVGTGTGLGLSVSYGIVQEQGGLLEVRSRRGEGAVFAVLLPMKRD